MVPGNGTNGENDKARVAAIVQYDGTGFSGWQIQKSGRTVQDEIEKALTIFFREDIRVVASGRTDSGVHARGQVIHFDTGKLFDLKRLCFGLNGILASDVSITNAYRVPSGFHARFGAVKREYIYRIYNHYLRTPFVQHRVLWVKDKLDFQFIQRAAGYLIGEHDFASFCKKISSDVNTVRTIDEIDVSYSNEIIAIRICGNSFLHNMIRIIIGTILELYKNGSPPETIKEIMARKDRRASGPTASPCGLYLNRVTYEPPLDIMESAY